VKPDTTQTHEKNTNTAEDHLPFTKRLYIFSLEPAGYMEMEQFPKSTPPKFNSSPLKNDVWKRILSFPDSL